LPQVAGLTAALPGLKVAPLVEYRKGVFTVAASERKNRTGPDWIWVQHQNHHAVKGGAMGARKKGFVLHFTARCGSTFIIFTLRKHPEIYARAEVLANQKLPGGTEQTADHQIAFLRRYFRPYRTGSPATENLCRGFKVQIQKNKMQIKAPARYIKVLGEYDVCRFFLYRKNHVKQAVSSYRAEQLKALTRQLGLNPSAHIYDDHVKQAAEQLPPLVIDPRHLMRKLKELDASYRILDHMRAQMDGVVPLIYEDLLADRQAFFNRMFDAMGLSPIDVNATDEVKKVTSGDLRQVVGNFDALLTFFSDTVYAEQLLEP
jgi:LPS sulfotransferase NodH